MQYIFLFLLGFTGSKTVVSPLQLYNVLQQFKTRAKRSAQVPLYNNNNNNNNNTPQNQKNSPQSHKFTNSLQHLPVTMQNNHIFHQSKLLSLTKTFQWAQSCAQLKHVIPTKPEKQRAPAV